MQDGTRIDKTVHYWLMEPVGGDLSRHDREFERVRWVSFDEAPAILTFETERSLVATAREVLALADAGAAEAALEPPGQATASFRPEPLA